MEIDGPNVFLFLANSPLLAWDIYGLDRFVFDGYKLCRITDDGKECKKCWEAASGLPDPDKDGKFDYSINRQQLPNKGPIPEGKYIIPAVKTDRPWKRGNWNLEDWNAYRINHHFWQTEVRMRSPVAWGQRFVRLEPQPGNQMFGRKNFNIHGGLHKGSAGCIDLGNNEIVFFDELRNDFAANGEALLIVDYSGVSSKCCDCIEVSTANWIIKNE